MTSNRVSHRVCRTYSTHHADEHATVYSDMHTPMHALTCRAIHRARIVTIMSPRSLCTCMLLLFCLEMLVICCAERGFTLDSYTHMCMTNTSHGMTCICTGDMQMHMRNTKDHASDSICCCTCTQSCSMDRYARMHHMHMNHDGATTAYPRAMTCACCLTSLGLPLYQLLMFLPIRHLCACDGFHKPMVGVELTCA